MLKADLATPNIGENKSGIRSQMERSIIRRWTSWKDGMVGMKGDAASRTVRGIAKPLYTHGIEDNTPKLRLGVRQESEQAYTGKLAIFELPTRSMTRSYCKCRKTPRHLLGYRLFLHRVNVCSIMYFIIITLTVCQNQKPRRRQAGLIHRGITPNVRPVGDP
jgi:hypothetical protein